MARLPHQIPAPGLKIGDDAIDLPDNQPLGGQVLTYSGTTGEMHWGFVEGAGGGSDTHTDIQDEGVMIKTSTSFIDFTGDAVVATSSGGGARVEISVAAAEDNLLVQDEGATVSGSVTRLNFAGEGVTATVSGTDVRVQIDATGGGGGGAVAVEDEGSEVVAEASVFDFVGPAVAVADAGGGEVTVTISGGPAIDLDTTSTPVNISETSPPTEGQVLIATSSTKAEWQTFQGPLTSAQGAYLQKSMSGSQSSITAGTVYALDTEENQRGDLSSTGNQFVGLKANRTYLLIAHMRTTSQWQSVQWYDVTGAAYLGEDGSVCDPTQQETITVSTVFTPTADSTVELRAFATGGSATTDGYGCVGTIVEIGAVQVDVVGGLEFVDIIEVAADTTSVTFGAGGDGAFGRALDGDVDEAYFLEYYLPESGGAYRFDVKPNGLATNQLGAQVYGGQSNGGSDSYTSLPLASQGAGCRTYGTAEIQAKTGKERAVQATTTESDLSSQTWSIHYASVWTDTSENITSLEIAASAASTLKAGAVFKLWRRTTNNLRADTAAVYERNVEVPVAQGTAAEVEYATGIATFPGSAVGIGIELQDTVTGGTVTARFKVGGSTVLTATLDTTNTVFHRAVGIVGQHAVAYGDSIEVSVETSGLVTTGAGTPLLTINATLINSAFLQPAPQTGPDRLLLGLSANQSATVAGLHAEFDTTAGRGDSISVSAGAGQLAGIITLAAGKTYKITAHVRCIINEGNVTFQWANDPSDVVLVDDLGIDNPEIFITDGPGTGDWSNMDSSVVIFTPSVDTDIKLEVISESQLLNIGEMTRVLIEELI